MTKTPNRISDLQIGDNEGHSTAKSDGLPGLTHRENGSEEVCKDVERLIEAMEEGQGWDTIRDLIGKVSLESGKKHASTLYEAGAKVWNHSNYDAARALEIFGLGWVDRSGVTYNHRIYDPSKKQS